MEIRVRKFRRTGLGVQISACRSRRAGLGVQASERVDYPINKSKPVHRLGGKTLVPLLLNLINKTLQTLVILSYGFFMFFRFREESFEISLSFLAGLDGA